MAWPERIVLGVIGRRADDLALVWAFGLARRWSAELHVIAGYHPPVGMFPHIVSAREHAAHRAAAHRRLARQIEEALDPGLAPGGLESRLTLVPDNQLADTLVTSSLEADLLLLSLAPTGVPLLGQRHATRARAITQKAHCPASLGPGRAGATVGA